MHPASLLGHLAELYTEGCARGRGLDDLTQQYYAARRYLGRRDRAWLSEQAFALWRGRLQWESLARHAEGLPELPLRWADVMIALGTPGSVLESWRRADDLNVPTLLPIIAEKQQSVPLAARAPEWWGWVETQVPQIIDNAAPVAAERIGWPEWLFRALGERVDELANGPTLQAAHEALRSFAPLALRVNTLKTDIAHACTALESEGLAPRPGELAPEALILDKRARLTTLAAYRHGEFEIQDEGSQLVGWAVDPQPGEQILDACAGGGGKSLHLAALLRNHGVIVATDRDSRRLEPLRERARRAGAGIIRIESPGQASQSTYDAVLLDAPCSGLGTLRRHPELLWHATPESVSYHAARQLEILRAHAGCVRAGGCLIYATCSWLREENDAVIEAFRAEYPTFSIESVAQTWHAAFTARGIEFPTTLRHGVTSVGHQLLPALHGCDAFFVSVLRNTNA